MHYVVRDAHLNKGPNCRILKLNSSTDYSNDAKNSWETRKNDSKIFIFIDNMTLYLHEENIIFIFVV